MALHTRVCSPVYMLCFSSSYAAMSSKSMNVQTLYTCLLDYTNQLFCIFSRGLFCSSVPACLVVVRARLRHAKQRWKANGGRLTTQGKQLSRSSLAAAMTSGVLVETHNCLNKKSPRPSSKSLSLVVVFDWTRQATMLCYLRKASRT